MAPEEKPESTGLLVSLVTHKMATDLAGEYRGEVPPGIDEGQELRFPNRSLARIGKRLRHLGPQITAVADCVLLLKDLQDKTAFSLLHERLFIPLRDEYRRLEEQAKAIWSRETGGQESEAPDMRWWPQ